jgi:hypothetical protein
MNCDDDYVNKAKGKSDWGEYHDGNIFNKHIDFWRSTRPMTSFRIFIAYINTEGILFNVKITK